MNAFRLLPTLAALSVLLVSPGTHAQVVAVTLRFETNRIELGSSTILRAFAQIAPPHRAGTDRIFSWYVDLLNATGAIARADFGSSARSASDQDPRTSSNGKASGPDQRGIYDTFINLPDAGRDTPVELFSVPVKGLAPGRATFRLQAGSGVDGLSGDFIVAPSGGGEPLLGGDYSAADAELEVVAATAGPRVSITRTPVSALEQRLTIYFSVAPDHDHFVEFKNELAPNSGWQILSGGPHNTGSVTDTNSLHHRFYRLRISP